MTKLIIASAMVSLCLVVTGIFIGVTYNNTILNMAGSCDE
jgi:ABC-type multidrug transport system permease subunit